MEKMLWEKPEMNEVVFPANAYCSTCESYLESAGIIPGDYELLFEADGEPDYAKAQIGVSSGALGNYLLLMLNKPYNSSKAYFEAFVNELDSRSWDADQSYGYPSNVDFVPCGSDHKNVTENDEGVYLGWYHTSQSPGGWKHALIWWDDTPMEGLPDGRLHASTTREARNRS